MKTNSSSSNRKGQIWIVILISFIFIPSAFCQDWKSDGDEAAVFGFQDYRTGKSYDESDRKNDVRWIAVMNAEGYDVFRYDEKGNPNSFLIKLMLITQGEYHTTLLPGYVEHRLYQVKNPEIYVTTNEGTNLASVSRDYATVASNYKTMWAKEREEDHNMFVYESILDIAAELAGVGMIYEVEKIVSKLPNLYEGVELPVKEHEGGQGKAGTRWMVSSTQRRSYLTAARVDAEAVKNNAFIPVEGQVEFEKVVYWEPIIKMGKFERTPLEISSFSQAFSLKGTKGSYYIFRYLDREKKYFNYYAVYIDDHGFNEQLRSGIERLAPAGRIPGPGKLPGRRILGEGTPSTGPIAFLGTVEDSRFDLNSQRIGTTAATPEISIVLNEEGRRRLGGDLSFSFDDSNLAVTRETAVYQAILRRLAGAILQSENSFDASLQPAAEFQLGQIPGLNPNARFLKGLSYNHQSTTSGAKHTFSHKPSLIYNGARPGGPSDYAYMGLRNVQLPNMKAAADGTPEFTYNVLPSVFVSTTQQFKVMADGFTKYSTKGIHEMDLSLAVWPMSLQSKTTDPDKVEANQIIVYTANQAENQSFDVYTESIQLQNHGEGRNDFPQVRFFPYWVELGITTGDRKEEIRSLGKDKGSILHYVPVNQKNNTRKVPLLVISVPVRELPHLDREPPIVDILTPREGDQTDAVEEMEVSLSDNLAVDPSTLEVWINGQRDPNWVAELVDFPSKITAESFTSLNVRLHKTAQTDYRKGVRIAVPKIKAPGQPLAPVFIKIVVRDALGNLGQQSSGTRDIRRPKLKNR